MKRPLRLPVALIMTVGLGAVPTVVPVQVAAEELRQEAPARAFDFDGDGREEVVFPGYRLILTYEAAAGRLIARRIDFRSETAGGWSSGDLDRDGFADLVLGMTGQSIAEGSGRILVLFGSPDGLTKRRSYSVQGPPGLQNFGMASTVADFDADGWLDVAVGAPDPYQSTEPSAAAVVVLSGSDRDLSLERSVTVIPEDEVRPYFGLSLAAGDVNGDGAADLIEHNPWGSPEHLTWSAGSVSSVNGAISMGTPVNLGAADVVAVGDLTADGVADVVAGLRSDGGSFTVYPGGADGPAQGRRYTQDSPSIPGQVEVGDRFGVSLAILRANKDRYLDLAVGAAGEDVGRVQDAGQVTVLLSDPDGVGHAGVYRINQKRVGIPGRARRFRRFGQTLERRDIDGRGRPELVVSSRYEASPGNGDRDWDTALTVLFHPLRSGPAWDLRNIPNVCC